MSDEMGTQGNTVGEQLIGFRARAEAAEAENAKLHSAPLCGGHAEAWYTSRDNIQTESGCIWCDWEARCKQKDAALRIALEELEFDRDFAVVKGSGEKRKVDEAIGLVRTALSDTAQQETGDG